MPCCIDRMRFSPRFSIRKKNSFLLFFFLFFFCQVRDLFVSGLVREKSTLESLCMGTLGRHVGGRPAAATSSGGSSAVEQRTVKCASAAILWSGVQISLSGTLFVFVVVKLFKQVVSFFSKTSSYGHTTVKAPHPIRTAKLSTVGLDQYFGRGLQGNLQCCMAFLFFC